MLTLPPGYVDDVDWPVTAEQTADLAGTDRCQLESAGAQVQTMNERDRPVVQVTPAMVDAGVAALVNLEDETCGYLSRSSLERLAVGVFEEMLAASVAKRSAP